MTPSLRAAGAAGTATLAALLLAACGSSSSSYSSSGGNASSGQPTASTPARAPAGASKKQVEVTIKSYAYHPAALTVASGTRITFVNQDPTAHTATAIGSQKLDTGTLNSGQRATVTVTAPGTYSYICQFHAFMRGTVTVTG